MLVLGLIGIVLGIIGILVSCVIWLARGKGGNPQSIGIVVGLVFSLFLFNGGQFGLLSYHLGRMEAMLEQILVQLAQIL